MRGLGPSVQYHMVGVGRKMRRISRSQRPLGSVDRQRYPPTRHAQQFARATMARLAVQSRPGVEAQFLKLNLFFHLQLR